MNGHEIINNPAEDKESPVQLETKTYHTPQLREWGDLQQITKGSTTPVNDQEGVGASSTGFGKRKPDDYPLPPFPNP
jgi:hypothetical protein